MRGLRGSVAVIEIPRAPTPNEQQRADRLLQVARAEEKPKIPEWLDLLMRLYRLRQRLGKQRIYADAGHIRIGGRYLTQPVLRELVTRLETEAGTILESRANAPVKGSKNE